MKDKKDAIIATGTVTEALPNGYFRAKLDKEYENLSLDGKEALVHLSGRMRMHYIKVLLGDRVKVELSSYDTSNGRIVQRF